MNAVNASVTANSTEKLQQTSNMQFVDCGVKWEAAQLVRAVVVIQSEEQRQIELRHILHRVLNWDVLFIIATVTDSTSAIRQRSKWHRLWLLMKNNKQMFCSDCLS